MMPCSEMLAKCDMLGAVINSRLQIDSDLKQLLNLEIVNADALKKGQHVMLNNNPCIIKEVRKNPGQHAPILNIIGVNLLTSNRCEERARHYYTFVRFIPINQKIEIFGYDCKKEEFNGFTENGKPVNISVKYLQPDMLLAVQEELDRGLTNVIGEFRSVPEKMDGKYEMVTHLLKWESLPFEY